jgi:hypothetical protein
MGKNKGDSKSSDKDKKSGGDKSGKGKGQGKGKGEGDSDDKGGKAKGAQSINVRHILVRRISTAQSANLLTFSPSVRSTQRRKRLLPRSRPATSLTT